MKPRRMRRKWKDRTIKQKKEWRPRKRNRERTEREEKETQLNKREEEEEGEEIVLNEPPKTNKTRRKRNIPVGWLVGSFVICYTKLLR